MRVLGATVIAIAALGLFAVAAAFAADPHAGGQTGQPNQTCLSDTAPNEPGNAANSPGSPFNEPSATSNGGTAGGKYAGSGQNTNTPANGHAVSQYDVSCFQVSQH